MLAARLPGRKPIRPVCIKGLLMSRSVRVSSRASLSLMQAAAIAATMLASSAASAAEMSIGEGGSFRVTDGDRTFQIAGRAVVGTAFYDEDVTDLPTGFEMDLMILQFRAQFGEDLTVNVSYNFVEGALFDTSITRSNLPIGDLQIGQFRPQIGLFDGGAWIIFAQRSMVEQELTIPRTLGIGLEGQLGPFSYALNVNGDQIGDDTPGDDPLKYSTRFVARPFPASWGVAQLGVNLLYQEVGDTRINDFSVNPIPALDDTPTLLEVSHPDADYRDIVGGEALWMRGPLTFQSEYMKAKVDSPGRPTMDGYYVQGVYIRGAQRGFSERTGTLTRPILANPSAGAWEFGVRYDTVDFGRAGGGAADIYSLAIVRYFSNPLRVGATFSRSDITGGLNGDETIDSVQIRAQWFL